MIFVVGNSRSGTTMMGRILGRNSRIYTFGELHFFEHLVDSEDINNRSEISYEKSMSLLERLFTTCRDGFFETVIKGKYASESKALLDEIDSYDPLTIYYSFLKYETTLNNKDIPCEQTPRYLFLLSDILKAFPDCRVINMIRDPRDVLKSQKRKWKRRFLGAKNIPLSEALRAWANYHPLIISKLWVSCINEGDRFQSDYRVMSIQFEELLQNPSEILKEVASFLKVEFDEQMLQVPQVGSSAGVDAPERLGINQSIAHSWKDGGLSNVELGICEWVSLDTMKSKGYKPLTNGKFSIKYIPSIVYCFFKLFLTVPLNLLRARNFYKAVKRRLFVRK